MELGQLQAGGGPVGSRHPAPSGIRSHPSSHPRDITDCSACLVASSPPALLSVPDFRQWFGSWGARATPPNSVSLLLQEICALSVPTSLVQRSPRRGAGAVKGAASHALSLRWARAPATGRWWAKGVGSLPTSWLRESKSSSHPRPAAWGWAGPQAESAPSLLLHPRLGCERSLHWV